MQRPHRSLVAAAFIVASASSARGQVPADPTGHWQGVIQAPAQNVSFEVDLARNGNGQFEGTLGIPGQKLKGLPLTKIAVDGPSITFYARSDQPLRGVLSADGASMSGDFFVSGSSVPFAMARTGAPRIEAAPKSAAITKTLEGTWNATLEIEGMTFRLVMMLSNHADGTASGRIVNLDEGSLEIPLRIAQAGSNVTLDSTVLGSSFAGTINAAGTELAGTFTENQRAVAVTFERRPAERR
jgi:hypothetical protein